MSSYPSQPPRHCLNSVTGKSPFENVVTLDAASGSRFKTIKGECGGGVRADRNRGRK